MNGAIFYVRSRGAVNAAAVVVAVGAVSFLVAEAMTDDGGVAGQTLIPIVVMAPAAMAVAVLATIDEPSAEIAAATPFRVGVARAVHVLALLGVAVACLTPLASFEGVDLGSSAAIRNLTGYIGLGLIFGPWARATWAWTAPVVFSIGTLTIEGASRTGALLFWPMRPDSDEAAWLVASSLVVAGMAACLIDQPQEPNDDGG